MLDSLTLLRAMNGIHEEDVVMAENSYYEKTLQDETNCHFCVGSSTDLGNVRDSVCSMEIFVRKRRGI